MARATTPALPHVPHGAILRAGTMAGMRPLATCTITRDMPRSRLTAALHRRPTMACKDGGRRQRKAVRRPRAGIDRISTRLRQAAWVFSPARTGCPLTCHGTMCSIRLAPPTCAFRQNAKPVFLPTMQLREWRYGWGQGTPPVLCPLRDHLLAWDTTTSNSASASTMWIIRFRCGGNPPPHREWATRYPPHQRLGYRR